MRGKVRTDDVAVNRDGITPAYAGKRQQKIKPSRVRRDHPRLCGEKRRHSSFVYDFIGSPPPMRGKAMSYTIPAGTAGITPAYAGKRVAYTRRCAAVQDHPRLCGEKPTYCVKICRTLGSPPPMRGKALHAVENAINLRITPAYAGKRSQHSQIHSKFQDHPRLCGEKV